MVMNFGISPHHNFFFLCIHRKILHTIPALPTHCLFTNLLVPGVALELLTIHEAHLAKCCLCSPGLQSFGKPLVLMCKFVISKLCSMIVLSGSCFFSCCLWYVVFG